MVKTLRSETLLASVPLLLLSLPETAGIADVPFVDAAANADDADCRAEARCNTALACGQWRGSRRRAVLAVLCNVQAPVSASSWANTCRHSSTRDVKAAAETEPAPAPDCSLPRAASPRSSTRAALSSDRLS